MRLHKGFNINKLTASLIDFEISHFGFDELKILQNRQAAPQYQQFRSLGIEAYKGVRSFEPLKGKIFRSVLEANEIE